MHQSQQQNISPLQQTLVEPTEPVIAQATDITDQTLIISAVSKLETELNNLVDSGVFKKEVDSQGYTTYSLTAPDQAANLAEYQIIIPSDKSGFSEFGSYLKPLESTYVAPEDNLELGVKKGQTVNTETTGFASNFTTDDLFTPASADEIAKATSRVIESIGKLNPAANTPLW